jgi:hypothetical protein
VLFRLLTPQGRPRTWWFALEYAANTLLPAVTLRREFDDIGIVNGVRYYFVFLKVMGYAFVATLLDFLSQWFGRASG